MAHSSSNPRAKPKGDMKQSTLFSHIKGVAPPPKEQSSLENMWSKKRVKEDVKDAHLEEERETGVPKVVEASQSPKKTIERKASSSPKPKTTSSLPFIDFPAVEKNEDQDMSNVSETESDAPLPAGVRHKRKRAFIAVSDEDEVPVSLKKRPIGQPKIDKEENGEDMEKVEESASAEESGSEEEGESELEMEEEELVVEGKGKVKTKVVNKAASAIAEMASSKSIISSASKEYPKWGPTDPVPYAALIHCFMKIEGTTKRLEILKYLTEFLVLVVERAAPAVEGSALAVGKNAETASSKVKAGGNAAKGGETGAEGLLKVIYLCLNRLCPDYQGLELGIGESILIKAIGESTGRAVAKVKTDLKKEGDLGMVAMNSRANQPTMFKPKPLTVPFVFSRLTDIAYSTGKDSMSKKINIIKQMLSACQGSEAKFIIRSLEGKLRIGLAEKTIITALAQACVIVRNSDRNLSTEDMQTLLTDGTEVVKSVYSELPTLNMIIPSLMKVGVEGLKDDCKLTAGVPLKPMLAKPTKAITEVLDRFEGKKFTCEYKYDGERAQIHREEDGKITVFSRNSENMSAKYPDLVDQLPRAVKESAKSFVLDCEAVAWDAVERKLLPFQELSRRKRKDVKAEDITIKVHIFAFDILFLNGESLLQKQLHERRAILQENFTPVEGEFTFAKSSDGETSDEIQQFLEESVKDGCEGLMVKMLETNDSTYEPSRRSMNWLKLKKDYLSGVGDSLDLVVVGAYFGKGKRTNVYGAFLLACYDPDTEKYQTICKIGTGFSEEILEIHYNALKDLETSGGARRDIQVGGAKPDIWFEPKVVWEVLTADLSLSPIYTAAQGLADERGISLRFPRFLRIREDKDADQATSGEQIAEMYQAQAVVTKGKKTGGDDDFW
ncbi:dna ligase i [Phaffia rhodozyma]|uniref:DNA ligase n=1 Tax=Phaffia rhodozyma TaxID=264483 RepID=A0A0F7SFL7_PHARH|nr:dna ligase i [Phaffia rhodozyma]